MKTIFRKNIKDLDAQQKMAWDNKIIWITVGSNLYGTATPESDEDFMGIFMPNPEYVVGLRRVNEVDLSIKSKKDDGRNDSDAIDDKFYEFRQYLMKALDCNPNILELIFVNSDNIKFINSIGEILLENRHLFPWKGLAQKFLGYSFSQKHKMRIRTEHYKTIKTAHEYFAEFLHEDTPTAFELRERRTMTVELFAYRYKPEFMSEKQSHFALGDLNVQKSLQLRKLKAMVDARFSKATNRKGLMEKYGFDTKYGSHLVRLMLEGQELLETGQLIFPLKESQLILDIKLGRYTMEEILEMADNFEADIEIWRGKSDLPAKPQFKKVETLCMELIKYHLGYSAPAYQYFG